VKFNAGENSVNIVAEISAYDYDGNNNNDFI